jgi:hypothetical protein
MDLPKATICFVLLLFRDDLLFQLNRFRRLEAPQSLLGLPQVCSVLQWFIPSSIPHSRRFLTRQHYFLRLFVKNLVRYLITRGT